MMKYIDCIFGEEQTRKKMRRHYKVEHREDVDQVEFLIFSMASQDFRRATDRTQEVTRKMAEQAEKETEKMERKMAKQVEKEETR